MKFMLDHFSLGGPFSKSKSGEAEASPLPDAVAAEAFCFFLAFFASMRALPRSLSAASSSLRKLMRLMKRVARTL